MLLLLVGCSLTTFDYQPCTESAECRDAFGFGSVCGADGLCEALQVEERCSSSWPEDLLTRPADYRDAVVIGSLFDRSADIPEAQSARLAAVQVNEGGGLDGRPFAILECSYEENVALDSLTMEEATAQTAVWLADLAGVPAIIGPATSSQTSVAYTAVNLENNFQTLILSPSATSPALTALDGRSPTDENPGLLWRTAPPDSLQGTVQALDMIARGTREVAAIYEDGAYGNGLVDAFIAEFESDGRAVSRYPFSDGSQRDVAVQGAGDARFDEVLFISGEITDMTAFLDGASNVSGYAGRPIFLADGARDAALLTDISPQARPLLANVRGTAPAAPEGDVYETFAAAYAAEFSPDQASASAYTAFTYDATWLAMYGTAWAEYQNGRIDGPGIAQGLRHISDGAPIVIRSTSWYDVRDYFAQGSGIDVSGASGELDYDPATEETTAPIEVWVVNDTMDGFDALEVYEP